MDRALSDIRGMVEYQLIQTGPRACHLLFVAEGVEPYLVGGAAREALRGLYGREAVITMDVVEAIAPDPPGKYKLTKAAEPVDSDRLLDERFAPRAI